MKTIKLFNRIRKLTLDFDFIIGLAFAVEQVSQAKRRYIIVLPFIVLQLESIKND